MSFSDCSYMRRALELAKKARFNCPPNPAVGCVIVKDRRIIGEGFTQKTGEAHAEVMALRDAASRGESVAGATVYVTLEPCSHYGRTPPCALALKNAKVARVVAALKDPNPLVAGKGLKMLEEAGVKVECGLEAEEAEEINRGFLKRQREGMPWVRTKMAMSVDGNTALANGKSQWITSEEARADGHFWRGISGAVLTGLGTVLADNPQMTARFEGVTRQPLKGRKKHGGIRFGEMERDSIIAHGASYLLHERLLNSSDRHAAIICDKCGSMLSATAKQLTQQEAATMKNRMPKSGERLEE